MFWFKACPKCKGDLFLDNGIYSQDIVCLQCGYRVYLDPQDDCQVAVDSLYILDLSASNSAGMSNESPRIHQERKQGMRALVK
ncbi:MAG: hypothetical protein JSW16_00950 [Dehalococcoidales bacterium]|nr:MAG: hypothetical protein JSW16_00950 [Dehalococcoidales bacterium]